MDFWKEYAKVLSEEGGKDKAFLLDAFRGALGGAFLYQFFGYYALGIRTDVMPFEGLSEQDAGRAKGAIGRTGLWFGEESYGANRSNLSLEELTRLFESTISQHIDALLPSRTETDIKVEHGFKGRRRQSNLRPRDAMILEEVVKRMSTTSDRRASIYWNGIPDGTYRENETIED